MYHYRPNLWVALLNHSMETLNISITQIMRVSLPVGNGNGKMCAYRVRCGERWKLCRSQKLMSKAKCSATEIHSCWTTIQNFPRIQLRVWRWLSLRRAEDTALRLFEEQALKHNLTFKPSPHVSPNIKIKTMTKKSINL